MILSRVYGPGATLLAWIAAAAVLFCPSGRAAFADAPQMTSVTGTIVSVRQNILQLRPYLRHVSARVEINANTQIMGFEDVDKTFLKPGMRIFVRGGYSKETGFQPRFMDVSEKPVGQLAQPSHGLSIRGGGRVAFCTGMLKSVAPFVFTDDDGTDYTASLSEVKSIRHITNIDRNALMIGATIQAVGVKGADDVIQANSIVNVRFGFDKPGTMFAKILTTSGNTLTIQPRYTEDRVPVTLAPGCTIQKQVDVDPDTIKIGDPISFWAQNVVDRFTGKKSNAILAIALLIGKERYPAQFADKDFSLFLTGKLASLDPVQVVLPGGKRITVTIPGSMAIARVKTLKRTEIMPGSDAMFLLTPRPGGGFQTQAVIIDASPWLGYGT